MSARPLRVVVLHRGLNRQRALGFAELARDEDIDLRVWLTTGQERIRPALVDDLGGLGFQLVPLPGKVIRMWADHALSVNPDLLLRMARAAPDVIISLELSLPTATAAAYSFIAGAGLVIWNDTTAHASRDVSGFKRRTRRLLASRAGAVLAAGSASASYWESLGVRAHRIIQGGNAVDTAWWNKSARRAREQREAMRRHLSLTRFTLLYVGQLIPRKHVSRVLDLALACREEDIPIDVLIVGQGQDRAALERRAAAESLTNVQFLGYQDQDKLAELYVASDVFVLPSEDIWGWVVHEAMVCGLPAIVAPTVESAADLIVHGTNGYVLDFARPATLTPILRKARTDPDAWQTVGRAAAQHALSHFSTRDWASAARHAIGLARAPRRR